VVVVVGDFHLVVVDAVAVAVMDFRLVGEVAAMDFRLVGEVAAAVEVVVVPEDVVAVEVGVVAEEEWEVARR